LTFFFIIIEDEV